MKMEPINIFDFDGTLTTETWPKFGVWVEKFGYNGTERNENLEKALSEYRNGHVGSYLETFFAFFNDLLVNNNQAITYEELMKGEKYIKYNLGANDFIEKSSAKNYIVSSGLKEFLENLKIAKYFAGIYGTPVKHNEKGLISGIGEAMTDDKKILAICDILKNNNRQGNDCTNVYFIGDGPTDLPAMKFVHNNGGKAIFVNQPNQDEELYHYSNNINETLNRDEMVDFYCTADYRNGSILSNILQR